MSLILVIFLMIGIGLVQVYSSSFILATETRDDGLFFFKRQMVSSLIAMVAVMVFALIPNRLVKPIGLALWAISVLGLIVTFLPGAGHAAGGAARWINFGFVRFEPSELFKVSAPILVAFLINKTFHPEVYWDRLIKAILIAIPVPLLLFQPDFGTFTIYILVVFAMYFLFGLNWKYIAVSVLIAAPTFYFLVMSKPYRRARLMAFLDPWSDPTNTGFQVIQSLLSFSSGGLTGVGLGEGQGKLFFLPEAHTDFTLAVLGEEAGFIGVALVLFLYGFLVVRGFRVGARAQDPFLRAVALGLSVLFALQVATNAGVVLGLLPPKGLTLPFLSYGGSSLVVTGVLFGLLLNIDRENHQKG